MLHIHNNLTRRKEAFKPIDPNNVRLYVCGMTVYDFCHIGHARVMVVFDVVARYLRKVFGDKHVTYVRNITDIDDKIIKRANENGEPFTALTQRFIDEMNKDADALGVLRPDQEPKATTYIAEIVAMIDALIKRGFAYHAKNNDVYYDVSKFVDYGKLSGKQIDELQAGARVEVDEVKDDPLDFVLWKAAKPNEPSWDSPWGKGRPGWHIECSAMSTRCLGDHFDIHGGGMDLQFPHHENEIAQSEGATGCKFVNVWMHNGFVRINEEKMSKSLGNFFTVREVLKVYDPEVVRFFILASHYRSPLDYSDKNLDAAKASLTTLYTALRGLDVDPLVPGVASREDKDEDERRFYDAMNDDFNTPGAISVLFDVANEANRLRAAGDVPGATLAGAIAKSLGGILGLLQRDPEAFLKGRAGEGASGMADADIDALIARRLDARKNKNWKESDRIRDELKAAGIILEDGPKGTTWRRS
jgi:cysteinyl-tRNA synthetase